MQERAKHSAWTSPAWTILMGGDYSGNTTEMEYCILHTTPGCEQHVNAAKIIKESENMNIVPNFPLKYSIE